MPRLDHTGRLAEQQRALHRVLELADVAGPRVRHSSRAERGIGKRIGAGASRDEAARERDDVAGPLAQWRNLEWEHAEPVVEIFAEIAVAQVCSRSRLLVARTRTSRATGLLAPSGSTSRSCRTRSNFA